MQRITVVTSNKGKLVEWQRLFPDDFQLEAANIDLDEIQSLDLEAIVVDKAKRAFEHIGKPVLVEDVSAGLEKMGGLPGPFIKYFEIQMGLDVLFQLADEEGDPAVATCTIGYYDGKQALTARADVEGVVVGSRGNNGFGFDHTFVPKGSSKTYAEMEPVEKDQYSHRALAIQSLVAQLRQLGHNSFYEQTYHIH